MTKYELEYNRASRYINQLLSNTTTEKYQVYVSEGERSTEGPTYCIRVNEMQNRALNISFMTTLFILKQLSQKGANICWPKKAKIRSWFSSFDRITSGIHAYQIANGQADSIIYRCNEWHQP